MCHSCVARMTFGGAVALILIVDNDAPAVEGGWPGASRMSAPGPAASLRTMSARFSSGRARNVAAYTCKSPRVKAMVWRRYQNHFPPRCTALPEWVVRTHPGGSGTRADRGM